MKYGKIYFLSSLLIIFVEEISIAGPHSSICIEIFVLWLLNACQMTHVNGFLLYQKVSFYTCSRCFQKLVFSLDLFLGLLGFFQFLIPVIHGGFFDQLLDSDPWSRELFWLFVCFCLNKINVYDFLCLCFGFDAYFSEFLNCVVHWLGLLSSTSDYLESFGLFINPVDDSLVLEDFFVHLIDFFRS